jgi:hypothetical protein
MKLRADNWYTRSRKTRSFQTTDVDPMFLIQYTLSCLYLDYHTTMTQQMKAPESRLLASKKCAEKSKELHHQAQCNVEKVSLTRAKGRNDDLDDGPSDSSRAPKRTCSSHSSSEDQLFLSLHSVHSTMAFTLSLLASDWQDDDDSESSDFESSFASLGCDDDDEEDAYQEPRKILAKQMIENAKPRLKLLMKAQSMRRMGREPSFRGTLGLIAE